VTEAEKLAALDRAATQEADDIAYYSGTSSAHRPKQEAFHAALVNAYRAKQVVLIGPDAVEAGIGPRTLPGKQSCKGCPALHTEDWREFLPEDDEWDSGTYGTCTAIPEGERGHSLGSYWSPASPVPDWCPATAALAALGVKP